MPIGTVKFQKVEVRGKDGQPRKVEKPFLAGTNLEITPECLWEKGWFGLRYSDLLDGLDIEYEQKNKRTLKNVRTYAVLPEELRCILSEEYVEHPGLALDKLMFRCADQSVAKYALGKVTEVNNKLVCCADWYKDLLSRWRELLIYRRAVIFTGLTRAPLTLHLARASALENAGICMHPIYGFAYMPGTGLKGLARAFAETVWLPTQSDQNQAWQHIEDVFGWASTKDRQEHIQDPNHPAKKRYEDPEDPNSSEIKSSSGSIIFYDAWPIEWPQLVVDIVNNHHPHYYTGKASTLDEEGLCGECKFSPDDPGAHPPGDWENPRPVYFLAVPAGQMFLFPLGKRREDVPDELLQLALAWLIGALEYQGAGAKTTAGYGAFQITKAPEVLKPPSQAHPAQIKLPHINGQEAKQTASTAWQRAKKKNIRCEFTCTLELVSPAFLAGAGQQADDCDLRPATLRGLLRWWWRTMHAGFLEVKTLRALEAALWGDTTRSGAIRTVIEEVQKPSPKKYQKQSKVNFNKVQKCSNFGIPNRDTRKTTQGLWYASYGMDDGGRQRFYVPPGTRWRVRLIARDAYFLLDSEDISDPNRREHNPKRIPGREVLAQAMSALWLLSHFGGLGSKSRKGFGSFRLTDFHQEPPIEDIKDFSKWNLEICLTKAADLRNRFQEASNEANPFHSEWAFSPSLKQMLPPCEVTFSSAWDRTAVWWVLDQVGFAYQNTAQQRAHNPEKLALGLPRQIHGPKPKPRPHQDSKTHKAPQRLRGPKGERHASPVHIHLEWNGSNWTARVVAFPAAFLPEFSQSKSFLEQFLKDFCSDLKRRAHLYPKNMYSKSK